MSAVSSEGEDEAPFGAVYTHEDEDDDEPHVDEDDSDDDDDDDDDEGLLSYLFDKSSLKQHSLAIIVALVATVISYVHVIAPNHNQQRHDIDIAIAKQQQHVPISTAPQKREKPLKTTEVHHHHSYRRMDNLAFCPLDFVRPSESSQEHIQRVLPMEEEGEEATTRRIGLDQNLELFEVNFPKEYIDIMNDYYIADETMDDFYKKALSTEEDMTENEQFQCLVDAALAQQHRSTVPMHTVGYNRPNIKTYYSDIMDASSSSKSKPGCSVKAIMDEQKAANKSKDIEASSLSYTGFTAKFTNLSTKPMNLFWDGKKKPKFRARVEPFESFATVTTPGNSFYFAPTYDKTHAVERWVMTEDEAMVAYDTLTDDEELRQKLTVEEKKMFTMQKLNMHYAREYLAKTQRTWLSMFPRPMPMHRFHPASYFGQQHVIQTSQSHFTSLPTDRQGRMDVWRRLDYADYDRMNEDASGSLNLAQYRAKESLELTLTTISVTPRAFEIDNFLSDVEVQHLLEMATMYNTSQVDVDASSNDGGTSKKKKKTRSAATTDAWIRREMSPIIDAIYHRSADLLQIDESLLRHRNEHEHTELATHHSIAEAMHLSQYTHGQGYPPISDAAQASLKNRYQPNRFATIMFFLNDVGVSTGGDDGENDESGGDTVFPLAINAESHDGIRVKPKKGKAILLYNMLPDGNIDDLSQHSSEMLHESEKWMGSIYVWDPIID